MNLKVIQFFHNIMNLLGGKSYSIVRKAEFCFRFNSPFLRGLFYEKISWPPTSPTTRPIWLKIESILLASVYLLSIENVVLTTNFHQLCLKHSRDIVSRTFFFFFFYIKKNRHMNKQGSNRELSRRCADDPQFCVNIAAHIIWYCDNKFKVVSQ